jgi:dTDP-4-dehydrorhamnose 3,5-epimerase
MQVIESPIPSVKVIKPTIHGDERGFFFESFQRKRYQELLSISDDFVQDNLSRSEKNVLRGLHYQREQTQGKLVSVLAGCVFDVAVDVRHDSPTFGAWFGVELSSTNKQQLWVPKGFAHGFIVLSETADFYYKCTDYYHPESEVSIAWDDPEIGIKWPLGMKPVLSSKDQQAFHLSSLKPEQLLSCEECAV